MEKEETLKEQRVRLKKNGGYFIEKKMGKEETLEEKRSSLIEEVRINQSNIDRLIETHDLMLSNNSPQEFYLNLKNKNEKTKLLFKTTSQVKVCIDNISKIKWRYEHDLIILNKVIGK